jgi:hypothetical protein
MAICRTFSGVGTLLLTWTCACDIALRAFAGVDALLLRGVIPVPVPDVLALPGDFEGVFDAFPAAVD